MIGCYILFSKKLDRFYIGVTQDNIEKRILSHNTKGYGNNHYTAKTDDWMLFLFIESIDFCQARKIERQIKKMKSRVYIENLLNYPEMVFKLKEM